MLGGIRNLRLSCYWRILLRRGSGHRYPDANLEGNVLVTTEQRIRGRLLCVALLGVVPLTLFVQWSDIVVGGTMVAGPFPPLAACLQWGLLLAFNAAVARTRRGRGQGLFTRNEMLALFAIWATANMVAGRGLVHPLLASLVGPTYYARGVKVTTAVHENLPNWFAVTDKNAVSGFFEGYGVQVPWAVWRRPLLTWALFFTPFLTANLCLCALFERIWVRHERLAFPLVALPLERFDWDDPVVGRANVRRAIGVGVAFPLLLHGFGVAHAYVPGIPCVPFYNDVSALVSVPPWTAIRPLYANLYPLLIGLTFLAPTDVTFSVWFFLVLNKVELLVTAMAGWNDGPSGGLTATPPYVEEQSAGAYLVLAGMLIWNARHHLLGMARTAIGRASERSRSEEDYRVYRPLLSGFVFGVLGVLTWCHMVGMPLWLSAGFFGFTLVVALVLGRLMAEGGVTWILAPILPDKLLLSLTGSRALSPMTITRLSLRVQHLRDTRQMLAPAAFEAGKLRDAAGVPIRAFYGLLLTAVALTVVLGVYAALPLFYRYGALSLAPNSDGLMMSVSVIPTTGIGQISARLNGGIRPNPTAGLAVIAGAVVTWGLSLLRMRYPGWPLHPLGYALTGTLQQGYANKMLLSIFLGWAFKSLALRMGGVRGFRLLRGVALGLILGDLLMGGILKALDALLGPSGYAIF